MSPKNVTSNRWAFMSDLFELHESANHYEISITFRSLQSNFSIYTNSQSNFSKFIKGNGSSRPRIICFDWKSFFMSFLMLDRYRNFGIRVTWKALMQETRFLLAIIIGWNAIFRSNLADCLDLGIAIDFGLVRNR